MTEGHHPRILASARKHGVPDDDIVLAFRNPIRMQRHDDGLTMIAGPARSGQLLEVGFVEHAEEIVIVHAMKLRPKLMR